MKRIVTNKTRYILYALCMYVVLFSILAPIFVVTESTFSFIMIISLFLFVLIVTVVSILKSKEYVCIGKDKISIHNGEEETFINVENIKSLKTYDIDRSYLILEYNKNKSVSIKCSMYDKKRISKLLNIDIIKVKDKREWVIDSSFKKDLIKFLCVSIAGIMVTIASFIIHSIYDGKEYICILIVLFDILFAYLQYRCHLVQKLANNHKKIKGILKPLISIGIVIFILCLNLITSVVDYNSEYIVYYSVYILPLEYLFFSIESLVL